MLENVWKRCCELANNKTEHLPKASSLCLHDDQIQKKESENKGELSEVCINIVL